MSCNQVVQSGNVTPGHIATWVTDGVIQDSGASIVNTYGTFLNAVSGINFNSAGSDTPIAINLPVGFTRYRLETITISGASANINAATVGVFTSPAGGGVPVVTSGTSVTVNTPNADTVNNMQTLTINNQAIVAWSDSVLFFRVQNASGSPAVATVTVAYRPLP